MLTVNPEGIPSWLKAIPRWVVWRRQDKPGDKAKKVPWQPRKPDLQASENDPSTWGLFEDAMTVYRNGRAEGVGFVFINDGIICIDLDGWIDKLGGPRQDIVKRFCEAGAYIEVSPSGKGLHVIGRSDSLLQPIDMSDGIKLYPKTRYLTITGNLYNGSRGSLVGLDLKHLMAHHREREREDLEFTHLQGDAWKVDHGRLKLVDGMLDHGTLSCVYGAPKCGKTFFALHLAFAIGCGRPVFGLPTQEIAVAYVAGEGKYAMQNRQEAWSKSNPDVFSLVYGLPHALDLRSNERDVQRSLAAIGRLEDKIGKKVGLVILDTLARMNAGGDENSVKDMSALIHNCDLLRRDYDIHVMLIHHSGKDIAKGMRGSSAILGAVDTSISVEELGDGVRKVEAIDQRAMETGVLGHFMLDPVELDNGEWCPIVRECDAPPKSDRQTSAGSGVWQKPIQQALDLGFRNEVEVIDKAIEIRGFDDNAKNRGNARRALKSMISGGDLKL